MVSRADYDRALAQLDQALALANALAVELAASRAVREEPVVPVEPVENEEPLAPEIQHTLDGLHEPYSPVWRRVRGEAVKMLAHGILPAEVARKIRNGTQVEL